MELRPYDLSRLLGPSFSHLDTTPPIRGCGGGGREDGRSLAEKYLHGSCWEADGSRGPGPRRQLPEGQPGTGLPATGRLHPLLGLETSDVENPGEPVISKRSHVREKQHVTM